MVKEIPLTQGKVALVDDEDYDLVSKYTWHSLKNGNTFYASRSVGCRKDKTKTTSSMHRLIMNFPKSPLKIDHINGNGLDNTRDNLRICTNSQNQMNSTTKRGGNSSSHYKGVSWNKKSGKWKASIGITINGQYKNIYIGMFLCEHKAAQVYNEVAVNYFGTFAKLNTINIALASTYQSTAFPNWTSKYRGVYWDSHSNKWRVSIRVYNKSIYPGSFKTENEAAKAYNDAAMLYHGDKAKLNVIIDETTIHNDY